MELYSFEVGDGEESIVFLPGLGLTTRYWEPRVKPLSRRFRLVFVDLLGFGESPKPWVKYTAARHLDALHQVLSRHENFTLVGHSLGAVLAILYAARYPSQVKQLVLFGLPYFGSKKRAFQHLRKGPTLGGWIVTNMFFAATTCLLTRWLFGRLLPSLFPSFPREVAEDLVKHSWRSSTSSLWEVIYKYDLFKDAANLDDKISVVCVHGDQDATAPLEGVEFLVKELSDWKLHLLSGIDHHPLLFDPAACLHQIESAMDSLSSERVTMD